MKNDIEWYFYMDEVVSTEAINYADAIGQVGEIYKKCNTNRV
jgi:hypothetical protein